MIEETYLQKPITPDILPFNPRYLSPKYHISTNKFKKLRLSVAEMNGGIKCQNCGYSYSKERIDLHESFLVTENKYTFLKFVLLCTGCHSLCHPIYINHDSIDIQRRFYIKNDAVIEEYVKNDTFENNKIALKFCNKRYHDAYKFSLSDEVTCDYSVVDKY